MRKLKIVLKIIEFFFLLIALLALVLLFTLFTFGYGLVFLAGFYWHKYRLKRKQMKATNIVVKGNVKKKNQSGLSEAKKH